MCAQVKCSMCVFVITHTAGRVKTVAHMFSFWEMKNGKHNLSPPFPPLHSFWDVLDIEGCVDVSVQCNYLVLWCVMELVWRSEEMSMGCRVKLLPKKTLNNHYAQNLRQHSHFSIKNKTDSWMARSNKACHLNTYSSGNLGSKCLPGHPHWIYFPLNRKQSNLANKISLLPLAFAFFTMGNEWSGSKQRDN